jgi:hypothetical protein
MSSPRLQGVRRFSAWTSDEPKVWRAEMDRYASHLSAKRAVLPQRLLELHEVQTFHDAHVQHAETISVATRRDILLVLLSPRNGPPPNDGEPVLYVLHFQDVHSDYPLPKTQQEIAFTDLDAEDGNSFLTFQFSDGSAWAVSFRNFDYYAHDYDI